MSYDMSIGDEEFNYTYNVAPMWYACYPNEGIRKHYGKTGRKALPILRKLRDCMEANEGNFRDFEPSNGWGSYEGALEFVNRLIMASIRNPDETWQGD